MKNIQKEISTHIIIIEEKLMTSKPEDRLRKNGVKTRKYYKWLRWSMKNRDNTYEENEYENYYGYWGIIFT